MNENKLPLAVSRPLAGCTVLLIEDEGLGPSQTERLLRGAGARVLLAHNAYQAALLVRHHDLTAAVLDTEIGAPAIASIGALLRQPAVPFLLLVRSGEVPEGDWQDMPVARSADEAILLIAALAAGLPPCPRRT
jgi:CheY-like chemotaxis protein